MIKIYKNFLHLPEDWKQNLRKIKIKHFYNVFGFISRSKSKKQERNILI